MDLHCTDEEMVEDEKRVMIDDRPSVDGRKVDFNSVPGRKKMNDKGPLHSLEVMGG